MGEHCKYNTIQDDSSLGTWKTTHVWYPGITATLKI